MSASSLECAKQCLHNDFSVRELPVRDISARGPLSSPTSHILLYFPSLLRLHDSVAIRKFGLAGQRTRQVGLGFDSCASPVWPDIRGT